MKVFNEVFLECRSSVKIDEEEFPLRSAREGKQEHQIMFGKDIKKDKKQACQ